MSKEARRLLRVSFAEEGKENRRFYINACFYSGKKGH
jgi:hypothetical protein